MLFSKAQCSLFDHNLSGRRKSGKHAVQSSQCQDFLCNIYQTCMRDFSLCFIGISKHWKKRVEKRFFFRCLVQILVFKTLEARIEKKPTTCNCNLV